MIDSRLKTLIVGFGVAAAVSMGFAEEGKRAFEIADYYRTARVGAPVASSDGASVAFTVRMRASNDTGSLTVRGACRPCPRAGIASTTSSPGGTAPDDRLGRRAD